MNFAIIYYSKSGHAREMGEVIGEGIRRAGGQVRLFSIEEPMDVEYINSCKGVIFGTPTYLASTCWKMKKWFEEDSQGISLAGKLGGVYATAHYAQGGGDIAIVTLIGHMLVKGMMVYSGGSSQGKPFIHLGPVALDAVEGHYEEAKGMFEIFGERFAGQAEKIEIV
ncbi:flavodoxin [Blautia sp. An249]|uniref:flavodoxin family protein n=1 Tax=Blautia sp. An249 TaxID=1965603 RepID=UPI000B3A68FD|nr:flavodoxin domain-containing protein [Blautia sp. An249]OUO79650.1 flavodoxin [Blautia sp. An249]